MSSHDMLVRGGLKLIAGTKLSKVMETLGGFGRLFEVEVAEGVELAEYGEPELTCMDDTITLTEGGDLWINLACWGTGHGSSPDGLVEMCEGLEALLREPGWIEVIDHDTSASNEDEAVSVRFLGRSEEERKKAQIAYGVGQAMTWLEPLVGSDYGKWMQEHAEMTAGLRAQEAAT